jgi:hypothetical protein
MKRTVLCIAACLVFATAARADEFHLKDGTKIIGTIVGYEGNSFRVKTSYGFALVDRSAVVSVTVSNPEAEAKEKSPVKPAKAKSEDPAKPEESAKAEEPKTSDPEKKAEPVAAKSNPTASPGQSPVFASAVPVKSPSPAVTNPTSSGSTASTQNAATSTAAATAPTTTAPPATAPEPEPVREEVRGNLYVNDTYGFQMYKPPDWDVIAGARAALPGSIVAMGTGDQTTYLIIGLVPASGTVQGQIAATNERLAGSFEGYHPETIHQTTVAGLPANEYPFHGAANGQEWTGTVALIQRGGNFFTILGVTSTNTDLVQMEQNVISRTIASLQFTTP